MDSQKWVYDFSEGSKEMKNLLGGKGANVAEMTKILGPDRVPRGFTITTEACVSYMNGGSRFPDGLEDQVGDAVARMEAAAGKELGNSGDPLLVSVRSGARASMPGMMDTVLNLGLNDASVEGLAERTANDRFAWDSYRRLVQMFGNVVKGVPSEDYEEAIAALKRDCGVTLDTELDVDDLRRLTATFKRIYRERTGDDFPQDPKDQLAHAIQAVFDSWNTNRAIEYRRINHIPGDWGTAVNVQQMVFGNKGDGSGSGVAFTREETTGAPEPSGDFLSNAQGEDVVSGVRTPLDIKELARLMPEADRELREILGLLERNYRDMQDVEFTIEEGHLYMLQTRNAKRPPQAAVRVAVDMVSEGLIDRDQALMNIDTDRLDALLHPTFDPHFTYESIATGVAASPGAAKGEIVFTADDAVEKRGKGRKVVLVRPFTEADDVAGFNAAVGIITAEGGKASHAALVARGMGIPCVAGAGELDIDLKSKEVRVNGQVLREGDLIALDGSTGAITDVDVPLVHPELSGDFETILRWADEARRLGVRANAETPTDVARAHAFGAEGVGLCRTEHMFMAADRQPTMRAAIMAATDEERAGFLARLQSLQQRDFEEIFEEMRGLPVNIRLLDPPLHEFLPHKTELEVEIAKGEGEGANDEHMAELHRQLDRVLALEETNPMLGTRGCRLGIVHPDIFEMQVRAIIGAAIAVKGRTGEAPDVEIMIPLVAYPGELAFMRDLVTKTARQVFDEAGVELEYRTGTMIELPRACLVAGEMATNADFFSFGTNDLTQTTLGFSRDDAERGFLVKYLEHKLIDRSPFESIDRNGVGQLVSEAARRGREANPAIDLGICGEHGGDPTSIEFFDEVGLDYVSCSPFRVPIARVAAAQARIAAERESG